MTDTQDAVARYDKYVELTDRARAASLELRNVQEEALDFSFEIPAATLVWRQLHDFINSVWKQDAWYEMVRASRELLHAAQYAVENPDKESRGGLW